MNTFQNKKLQLKTYLYDNNRRYKNNKFTLILTVILVPNRSVFCIYLNYAFLLSLRTNDLFS